MTRLSDASLKNQGQTLSVNRAIHVLFQQSKAGICLSWQIKPMILLRRPSTRGFSTMFILVHHCHENGSKSILRPEPLNQPKHQPRQRPCTNPPYRGWGVVKRIPRPENSQVRPSRANSFTRKPESYNPSLSTGKIIRATFPKLVFLNSVASVNSPARPNTTSPAQE